MALHKEIAAHEPACLLCGQKPTQRFQHMAALGPKNNQR